MQVLEMEELDTLVSNANRKRLNATGSSSRKKKGGILENWIVLGIITAILLATRLLVVGEMQ